MAGNWSQYERDCINILSLRYEYDPESNIAILPKGEHDAYQADAGILIDGEELFSIEFKKVLSSGDKCVMAPFTMTEENGLLELTDSAEQKINGIEGMLDVACEIQYRSEEIIPKEGKTAYVREWCMFENDEICEYTLSASDLDINFQMSLCMMVSDFYRGCKNATFFMIGETPFPFFNDWQHIYEYFEFYIQVRAKPSGGSKIRSNIMAELENAIYLATWIPDDDWYIEDGRMYISPEHELGDIFNDNMGSVFGGWTSENVFAIYDRHTGDKFKLNCSERDGWNMIKPHPVNLTVMPYGVYTGAMPDLDEAWAELDDYMGRMGGIF